jgi:hypothetical protein
MPMPAVTHKTTRRRKIKSAPQIKRSPAIGSPDRFAREVAPAKPAPRSVEENADTKRRADCRHGSASHKYRSRFCPDCGHRLRV